MCYIKLPGCFIKFALTSWIFEIYSLRFILIYTFSFLFNLRTVFLPFLDMGTLHFLSNLTPMMYFLVTLSSLSYFYPPSLILSLFSLSLFTLSLIANTKCVHEIETEVYRFSYIITFYLSIILGSVVFFSDTICIKKIS